MRVLEPVQPDYFYTSRIPSGVALSCEYLSGNQDPAVCKRAHPDHRHPSGLGDLFESLLRGLMIWDLEGDLVTWIGAGVDTEGHNRLSAAQYKALPNGWHYGEVLLPSPDGGQAVCQVPFITYCYATRNLTNDLRRGATRIPVGERIFDSPTSESRRMTIAAWPGWLIERDPIGKTELQEVRRSLGLKEE